MDLSIQDVMNDLVRADAARMSGRAFADLRGTGVVRRVRTRRTLRAAGVGGASAVAVGALAFGALNMPWETKAAPGTGTGGGDCAAPWPEPYPYVVQKRYADYLPETWMIIHPASEEIVLTITPEDVGQTWLVTYPSGATEVVPYSGAGEVRVDVPDGPSILLSVWMIDGGTEMAVTAYSVTPGGPLIAPVADCYSQGATPTPSSSAERTEQIASPFQCGFVFPSATQSVEGMAIEDTGWLIADEVLARLDRRLNTNLDSSGNRVSGPHVPVSVHVDATQLLPTFSLVDPAGPAITGGYSGAEDPVLNPPTIDGITGPAGAEIKESAEGLTFVAVSQATVIGTIINPWQPEAAPHVTWTNTSLPDSLTLINPEGAFAACPGATLGKDFDVYAVAGRMTMDSDRVTTGPFYVWSEIAKP